MKGVLMALAQAEATPDADHNLISQIRQAVIPAVSGQGQQQPGQQQPGGMPQMQGMPPGGMPVQDGQQSRGPTPGTDITGATQDLQRMLSGG